MKYPVYPEMKDSGVEWLGEIPEHWAVNRFKWSLKLNDGGVWGEEAKEGEGNIILRSTEINLDGSWSIDEPAIRKITTKEFKRYQLKENDLLITKSSGSEKHIGKTAIVTKNIEKINCSYSNFMQRLRTKEKIYSKYLFYFINGSIGRDQLFYYSTTTTGLRNLSAEIIEKINFTVPSFKEQKAIASFLDKETGRIDQLINKKEQLIELLQEKRQALISYAVTKGLDHDVPMKYSGISWLGEIPEHWRVSKIKYITAKKNDAIKTGPFGSHLTASDMTGSDIKVYNQQNVLEKNLEIGDNYITKNKYKKLRNFTIYVDDLLITTRGTIGRTCIVPDGATRGVLHPCLMRIKVNLDIILNKYLEILIEDSGFLQEQLKIESNATTIEVIYSETIKNIRIPLPTLKEQKKIIEYLGNKTNKIDTLIDKITKQISNLKEYRQALISNAVTGKIDVREIYQNELY